MIPTKEEIYQWYIIEDGAYKDAPKHFGITQWCFDNLCKQYQIRKDRHKTGKKSVATRRAQAGGKEAYNIKLKITRDKNIINKYGSLEAFYELKGKLNKKSWDNDHDNILAKINTKKKLNNSFNTSTGESIIYNYLCTIFDKSDIFREYSDNRYPFHCDFYIRSRDLFIELNLHWSHGGHLFNKNNKDDLQKLAKWEEKAHDSDYYKNAIETWTIRDVNKNNCAVSNKLNYLAIYNLNELYEVFKNE